MTIVFLQPEHSAQLPGIEPVNLKTETTLKEDHVNGRLGMVFTRGEEYGCVIWYYKSII